MSNLDFQTLIKTGSRVIIPIGKNQSYSSLLSILRRPEVTVVCDQDQRDIYLQLLLDKSPDQLLIKICPDQIIKKVILLMRDSKRVDHVNQHLRSVFSDLQVSPAVDAMTPHAIDNFVRTHQTPILKPIRAGKIGCIFSHLALWKDLLNSFHPAMLVMEDDIIPDQSFHAKLDQILQELPPTFDLLYLHLDEAKNYDLRSGTSYSFHLRKDVPREDTCAYLISRKGADKLVKMMKTIRETLGPMLKRQIETRGLETYTVKDALFANIGQKTSTQDLSQGMLKSNTCDSKLYVPH